MPKFSISRVIDALRTHHGLIVLTAEALGCSRQTLYNYAARYPAVADVLAQERDKFVDLAEQGLYHHLEAESPWAIALVLKTLGRSRGYGDATPGSRLPTDDTLAEWSAIQTTLLEALKGYPDAKLAIVEALNHGHSHESQNGHQ